jgi:leucyl aminopeptidase
VGGGVGCAGARSRAPRLWAFPLDDDFDQDIESTVADIRQCAVEGKGDHIHAARFLKRFVPGNLPWAHVDLSSATRTGGLAHVPSEATGFGARLVLQWLLGAASAA